MSDKKYKHKDVVWCKCGGLFWPGEVRGLDSLPDEIREGFLKAPKVVVKFFDEDGYEFVLNDKDIFPYNCDRKEEFIQKGIARSRRKAKEGATGGWYAKFPKDVVFCEKLTKGNTNILNEAPFAEKKEKKIDYSLIFGDPEEINIKREELSQKSVKKGRPRNDQDETNGYPTTPKPITHPRFIGRSDHTVRILTQPSTPYHIDTNDKSPSQPLPPKYNCHMCDFAATRINVIVLHNKSHSAPNRTNLANHERPKALNDSKGQGSFSDAKIFTSAKKRERVLSPKLNHETSAKRPRLNKKQKEEKKELIKEREEKKNAIFGDWSEDEHEEEEEKVKIKETIESTESIDSSQESNSEDHLSDDDFFSNTDDHHSVDSDDDFIMTKSKAEEKEVSIASTKPLRKRKVVLDSFVREQEITKSKKKMGEKSKIVAVKNKKTETVADAVNSLIKSKLQPNKTYVSSGRSRLNSRTEIVEVLRKTPQTNKNVEKINMKPKVLNPQSVNESELNISQVLSETALPEIPPLPVELRQHLKRSSTKVNEVLSSSDSGPHGGSSAEEPSSPPISPPQTTPSKKPGIMRKSLTRSIQLPTRPNGDSQLIKHESEGIKYAMISAKAKAKQLARSQMAKDELLARNEEASAKEAANTMVAQKLTDDNTNQYAPSAVKELKGSAEELLSNGRKTKINDESKEKEEVVKEKPKLDDKKRESPVPEDKTTVSELNKAKVAQTLEVNAIKIQTIGKSNESNSVKNSLKTNELKTSEFDFTDDQGKTNIMDLSSSRKLVKTSKEKLDLEKTRTSPKNDLNKPSNQLRSAESKPKSELLATDKIAVNKVPTEINSSKIDVVQTKPVPKSSEKARHEIVKSHNSILSKIPEVTKSGGVVSQNNILFMDKNESTSNLVQRLTESIVSKTPSTLDIKPAYSNPKEKPILVQQPNTDPRHKPSVKIISSSTEAVCNKTIVTTTCKQSVQIISKPTITSVSKTSLPAVSKSMISSMSKPVITVVSKPSVTLTKPTVSSFSKPTVHLVNKPNPATINQTFKMDEKKPTVTIISKPSKISIEKPAQFEISVPMGPNINSSLIINKPTLDPKKPVLATVSKLTIEPVKKPSAVVQNKTFVSDMNKPVIAGVNRLNEPLLNKLAVSVNKQLVVNSTASVSSKSICLPISKPLSPNNKPLLSPTKIGTKVVTLSQKQDNSVHPLPESSSSIQQRFGTHMLLSPTKGSDKSLTVSLEPKKKPTTTLERSNPIVKTVELPKRVVEVAAALKPSPTKPLVMVEINEQKEKTPSIAINLGNTNVSEFVVAVNDPAIDSNKNKASGNAQSLNDLIAQSENKNTCNSIDGLTTVNLSSGGLQFLGDQALAGSDSDGEMIYLLVDDGTDPNLENQTLYIDSSQLEAATGGMILQNESGSGPLLIQTSGERGPMILQTTGTGGPMMLHRNDGQVILQAASDAGQMLIQNADGQVVLQQDNGALSNVVIVEDKDASVSLHGLVTSADTTGGVATLPAHPSSSLLAQVRSHALLFIIFML